MFVSQITSTPAAVQHVDPYATADQFLFLDSSPDLIHTTPLNLKPFEEMSHSELMAEMQRLECELNTSKLPGLRSPPNSLHHQQQQHQHHHHAPCTSSSRSSISSMASFEEPAACQWKDCSRGFPNMDALVEHLNADHIGSGKSSYVCQWAGCDRTERPFSKRHKVSTHIRTHTGERPFECPATDCGKRFARPDSLATHMKTHSTNRPYYCPVPGCGKSFYHPRSLKKHEVSHSTTKAVPGGFSLGASSGSESSAYSSYSNSPVEASRRMSFGYPYVFDYIRRGSSLWQSSGPY